MNKKTCWLATAVLGMPLAALAQPNPADPLAPANPHCYQSAFADYKPWQDLKPGDWRALNNGVGAATSSHSGHGSQGAAPAAPAAAKTTPGQPAPAMGHGAHDMHNMPGSQK